MKRLLYIGVFPGRENEWCGMPQPSSDEILAKGFAKYVEVEPIDIYYHRDNHEHISQLIKEYDYIFLGNVLFVLNKESLLFSTLVQNKEKTQAWFGDAREAKFSDFLKKADKCCSVTYFTGRSFTEMYCYPYSPKVEVIQNWWHEDHIGNAKEKDIENLLPMNPTDYKRKNLFKYMEDKLGKDNITVISKVSGKEYFNYMARAKNVYSFITQNEVYYDCYGSSRAVHALINGAKLFTNINDKFVKIESSSYDKNKYHVDNMAKIILENYA